MNKDQLFKRSLEVIKEGQHKSGGYVACPSFPTYNYCWFRDSSYISYAMDLAGEHGSSGAFHKWAVGNILKRETEISNFINGISDNYQEVLHTRYTLTGEEGSEKWENFQLDSFGIWLWSLGEHLELSGKSCTDEMIRAVILVSSYLAELWQISCYDCWEENSDKHHIYTMATIYRGLQSSEKLIGCTYSDLCSDIKKRMVTLGSRNGHLSKYEGSDAVDSSLLGVYFPAKVFDIHEPLMENTIMKIQRDLLRSGGLHRYQLDTYYGGGIWPLLTAWLGICLVDGGDVKQGEEILNWIISKADDAGNLAEQYTDSLNDHTYLPRWIEKWGQSADPLLWSHAMYIILYYKLGNK